MKKTLLFWAVAAMCGTASATILRVNNTTGSGAPYADIESALQAAESGDTIMIDGSSSIYKNFEINKPLVIMGPGFWRTQNGISGEGASDATFERIKISAAGKGSVIRGLQVSYIDINANNVVVNRCYINNAINVGASVSAEANNCLIHQNFINGRINGYSKTTMPNLTQITNNIFSGKYYSGIIEFINEGYIGYNTFATPKNDGSEKHVKNIVGCTVEKNIFTGNEVTIDGNSYKDNYMPSEWGSYIYEKRDTDMDIKNKEVDSSIADLIAGKGAFNGDDPYVISGVPAGPVIQDVTVPASVEKGNNLNITIKLGVQK